MTASVWSGTGDIQSTANADNSYKSQRFSSLDTPSTLPLGTTVLTITVFAYAPGTGSLELFRNGVRQAPGIDFTETTMNSVTLTSPSVAGDIVDVVGLIGGTGAQAAEVSAALALAALAAIEQFQIPNLPLVVSSGGTGATTKAVAFNNLTPAVSKGDLITSTGAAASVVPVSVTKGFLTTKPSLPSGIGYGGPLTFPAIRAANTLLANADAFEYIRLNGTFTQTFDLAANLTADWFCYLENVGTGNITIPASDGRTNWIMYPKEMRLFWTDGINFFSRPLIAFDLTITSTSTFIRPPGYTWLVGALKSGAGSGGKGSSGSVVPGGGGGGYFPFRIPAAALNVAGETCIVGAGGASVTVAGAGNAGGASSIGTVLVMKTVSAYNIGSSITDRFSPTNTAMPAGFESSQSPQELYAGGSASGTDYTLSGSSIFGGGAGGSTNGTAGSPGGTSKLSGNGGAGNTTISGGAGTIPSGGGGSTATGPSSGAGARGEICIQGEI